MGMRARYLALGNVEVSPSHVLGVFEVYLESVKYSDFQCAAL